MDMKEFFGMVFSMVFSLSVIGGIGYGVFKGGSYLYNTLYNIYYSKEIKADNIKNSVNSFLKDMNPDLHKKIDKISKKIALTDSNLQKLYDLQNDFPNRNLIRKRIEQWQKLRRNLKKVFDNLYHKIEGTYIIYKMAKIEGKNKLNSLSKGLLEEADKALVLADITEKEIKKGLAIGF